MKKLRLPLIGLLQALGVIGYTALMSGFFNFLDKFFATPNQFWGPMLILALLVFSATITGLIVFGYPAYLALNKRVKEALTLLAFTLLYGVGMIVIMLIFLYLSM